MSWGFGSPEPSPGKGRLPSEAFEAASLRSGHFLEHLEARRGWRGKKEGTRGPAVPGDKAGLLAAAGDVPRPTLGSLPAGAGRAAPPAHPRRARKLLPPRSARGPRGTGRERRRLPKNPEREGGGKLSTKRRLNLGGGAPRHRCGAPRTRRPLPTAGGPAGGPKAGGAGGARARAAAAAPRADGPSRALPGPRAAASARPKGRTSFVPPNETIPGTVVLMGGGGVYLFKSLLSAFSLWFCGDFSF